ncbi:MAG: hypothetical protein O3B01_16540 [Planctomycetota bacterium]|nr:hypothetical protein [Planctomycetota bacterium]MDA1140184.1 hypothetical protein [Planctomycetota bacterium]
MSIPKTTALESTFQKLMSVSSKNAEHMNLKPWHCQGANLEGTRCNSTDENVSRATAPAVLAEATMKAFKHH